MLSATSSDGSTDRVVAWCMHQPSGRQRAYDGRTRVVGPVGRRDTGAVGRAVGEDEDQIRRTLGEYSQWCDDGRFDAWSDLFTEDARLVLGETVTQGREAIRTYMESVQPAEARGKHITSNSLMDIDGDNATTATDYLFVRSTPAGPAIVAAGRYHDELVRIGERWRFRQRTITMLGVPDGDIDG